MHPYQEKFHQQLVIRNLTAKTIDGYSKNLEYFLGHLKGKTPSCLTIADIHDYQYHLKTVKKHSPSYINAQTGSIKFFCKHVLNRDWDFDLIPYMKVASKLPIILEREAIVRLLCCTPNLKFRCLLGGMYGTGVRPFELVAFRPEDLYTKTKEMMVRVRIGKGRKERHTTLPQNLLNDLREYWKSIRHLKSEWDNWVSHHFSDASHHRSIRPFVTCCNPR